MNQKAEAALSRRQFLALAAAASAAWAWDSTGLAALAARIKPKEARPVVVIGGGLGGLSAAAHLARHGFPVTLVEGHDKPGGYATAFDRAAGRFTFDVSLHATSGVKGGPLRRVFEGAGVLDKVEMVELPELCRIITPDHDLIWPQAQPEAVRDQLCRLFPDQAAGVKGFFDDMLGLVAEAMKPFDRHSKWDLIRFPLTHRRMWSIRRKTLADVLDEHVTDPKLRSLLSSFCGYFGLPPSRLSGFLYLIAVGSMMKFGTYYARPRSQELSWALVEAIEAAGGKVLLGTEAAGIEMKGGAVSGVRLADGRRLPARAVISNANLPRTMKMLTPSGAPEDHPEAVRKYRKQVEDRRPSLSTFIVWLGLNQEIRGKVKSYEIFVKQGYDDEEAHRACLAGDLERGGLGVAIYDNAFEGYSQPGTSTVVTMTLCGYEPWRRFETDYFAGRKEAYQEEKERLTQKLIARTEELVIPGLRSMIEVVEAATPLTNRRYTQNPEGAIYGFEQSVANAYMNLLGPRTPFKGLYLASAWSSGGGYQPCLEAGANAFGALVRDWGEERPEE